jgi:hypothetical protein
MLHLEVRLLFMISLVTVYSWAIHSLIFNHAYADNSVAIIEQRKFRDSYGNQNVIGVVDNNGKVPVAVLVGLNITNKHSAAPSTRTIKETTFGRTIYPDGGAPFKFVIGPEQSTGKAFITNIKQIQSPYYNLLRLNYSNMPQGNDRSLTGTAKNIGPFDIHNVIVYASAHDRNGVQLDSVRSNIIPTIKAGQEVAFAAKPYPGIKSQIFYYSCAGFDLNAPISTLDVGKGQFIAYDLRALARISDFRYDNATDSIVFGITYYSPSGGPMDLKIPQVSEKQSVSVIMDGKLNNQASVKMDGKTVSINFFVPPEDHQIRIKGIKSS